MRAQARVLGLTVTRPERAALPQLMTANSTSSSRLQPYILMAAVALAVRLAVIPFLYTDWMDPFVLEHWAFGLVARSLAAGHGFGNVFADTGPTAVVSPVYAYLLAGVFQLFGTYTPTSIVAALAIN